MKLTPSRRIFSFSCLLLGVTLVAGGQPAFAQDPHWASLTVNSGRRVYDHQVANWIDEFFEDGSRDDGTVDSNIAMFFNACFGGDAVENFNDTTGEDDGIAALDNVAFTNATVASASSAGNLAWSGGYGLAAAETIVPGTTFSNVHSNGFFAREIDPFFQGRTYPSEDPQIQGDANRTIGGATSTHLLVWAGQPDAVHRNVIDHVVDSFLGQPNTFVHVLAGDGTQASGGPHVTGAATYENLRDTLELIGQQMDDGADEQFIFWETDHGNHERARHESRTVAPTEETRFGLVVDTRWRDNLRVAERPQDGITSITIIMPESMPESERDNVIVDAEGQPLGTLGFATEEELELPGMPLLWSYELPIPREMFLDGPGFILPDNFEIGLLNLNNFALDVEGVILGTGNLPQPPVPEPASFALATITLVLAGVFRAGRR